MKYITYSSLDNIKEIVNSMQLEIDKWYPKLGPSYRFGHEFARDVTSILGQLYKTQIEREKQIYEQLTQETSWTKWFPLGTKLDLTPFEVDEIIGQREAENEQLTLRLHELKRKINRLRCEPVRLYPEEFEHASLK